MTCDNILILIRITKRVSSRNFNPLNSSSEAEDNLQIDLISLFKKQIPLCVSFLLIRLENKQPVKIYWLLCPYMA